MSSLVVFRTFHHIFLETSPQAFIKQIAFDWPRECTLQLANVTLRYSPTDPAALHNVSLRIAHGEKVGVVGRTGSGKSSLIAAVCRCVRLDAGNILLGGLDVHKIGLDRLR